ncbi:uncharacterized protein LOC144709775 isoform X2 [Wolffia australiana]
MPSGAKKRKAAKRKKEQQKLHPQGGLEEDDLSSSRRESSGDEEIKPLSIEPSTPEKEESPSNKIEERIRVEEIPVGSLATMQEEIPISGFDSASVESDNTAERNTQLDNSTFEPQIYSNYSIGVLRSEECREMKGHSKEELPVSNSNYSIGVLRSEGCHEMEGQEELPVSNSNYSIDVLRSEGCHEMEGHLKEELPVSNSNYSIDVLRSEECHEMKGHLKEELPVSNSNYSIDVLRSEECHEMKGHLKEELPVSGFDSASVESSNHGEQNTQLDNSAFEKQMNSKCSTGVLGSEENHEKEAHLQVHCPYLSKERASWRSCCGIFDFVGGGKFEDHIAWRASCLMHSIFHAMNPPKRHNSPRTVARLIWEGEGERERQRRSKEL